MRLPLLLLVLCAGPLAAQNVTEMGLRDPVEFRGLHAVSRKVVWASGSGGRVYHTSTGGAHWTIDTIPGGTDLFLVDVWAADARRAWVVGTDFRGGYAAIYGTVDGGAHWTRQWELRDPKAFLDGLTCFDARHCLALGDPIDGNYLLLTTESGGADWRRVAVASLPAMVPNEAAFAASGTEITSRGRTAWFVTGGGARGRIWRSRDRGRSWDVRETPMAGGNSAGLFGIAMQNGRTGLATGGDYQLPSDTAANLLRTTDGGATWSPAGRTVPLGVRWGIAAAGHGTYLATAPTGTGLTRDGGVTWRALDFKPANTASCAGGVCWLAGKERLAKVTF